MAVLIGHFTSLCLVVREMASLCVLAYEFARDGGRSVMEMPAALKREMRDWVALLPLAFQENGMPASPHATVSDAPGADRGYG